MNKQFYVARMFIATLFLCSPLVFAQQDDPGSNPATDVKAETPAEPETPASQEVDINEDNYRQFMELKDANLQRGIIPENIFKPDSGLQKLEKLPEESQKHLRNQLREIIVQGDEWKPGDEETQYPYTPSAAASTDPALEKQELEAWGELVDSYNQREAQIYENSSGAQSAMGTENGTSSKPGDGAGSTSGSGQSGEGSEAQQAGQEGNADEGADTGSYSPNAPRDPNAKSTAGVSQNAMEFLQGLGTGGNSNTGEANQGDATEGAGPGGESPTPTEAMAESGQQGNAEQRSTSTGSGSSSARDPNAKSTAGASQNAMEFLKGSAGQGENSNQDGTGSAEGNAGQSETQGSETGSAQADGEDSGEKDGQADSEDSGENTAQADAQGDGQADGQDDKEGQDSLQTETEQKTAPSIPLDSTFTSSPAEPEEESTAGASQNALEYLKSGGTQGSENSNNEPEPIQPAGTLSIQDLLNAQGIGNSTGTNPAPTSPDEEPTPDKNKPAKDGGG